MHKRYVIILILSLFAFINAKSIDIAISTGSGNQLYPDVCWDGNAFWVVWQDDESYAIRGIRINEKGEFLTNEVEFMKAKPLTDDIIFPVVAAGADKIAIEARKKIGQNEFKNDLWAITYGEYSFNGVNLHTNFLSPNSDFSVINTSTPCLLYGKSHFFSFHTEEFQTTWDIPASAVAWGINRDSTDSLLEIWRSCKRGGGFNDLPPIACWNKAKFLVLYSDGKKLSGTFLNDSLIKQGIGSNFIIRENAKYYDKGIKSKAIVPLGTKYLFIGEVKNPTSFSALSSNIKIGFDILDSMAVPIKDSATIVNNDDGIRFSYPDAASNGNTWISCWEAKFTKNNTSHIYGIEVDTLGNILKSGYVVQKSPVDKHPAIAFGNDKYLLVWADNQDGNFNIYGKIFDTLELKDAVEEEYRFSETSAFVVAQPNIFSATTTLRLSNNSMSKELSLKIYNKTGSLVKELIATKGKKEIVWDGTDNMGRALNSGVYFVLPERENTKATRVIKLK